MNRNYLKYMWIAGVSILGLTGCDDYLNRESTSGVNTPDLIWQNPKAITAVLAVTGGCRYQFSKTRF